MRTLEQQQAGFQSDNKDLQPSDEQPSCSPDPADSDESSTKLAQVLVSPCDAHLLAERSWHVQRDGTTQYVICRQGGRTLLLHRMIAAAGHDQVVDHINGNGLDNRRENLRLCSHAENLRNRRKHAGSRSRFKGVSWHKKKAQWQAQICVNYQPTHLGYFDTEEEAARVYDAAAVKMHGWFARLNFASLPAANGGKA